MTYVVFYTKTPIYEILLLHLQKKCYDLQTANRSLLLLALK